MKKVLFLIAIVGSLYASSVDKCLGCHGAQFEKKALGKSLVVADMNSSKVVKALSGYKDGSYGGPMKGIMVNQVKDLNETQILEISKVISSLK